MPLEQTRTRLPTLKTKSVKIVQNIKFWHFENLYALNNERREKYFRMSNLKDIFGEVETILVENQEKRESIRDAAKELEAKVIASMQIIKRIHRGGKYEDTINEAKENMKFIPELYKNVQKLVPEGAFYKFHDIWRLSTVKCCMIMSFVTFLEKGSLITRKECAEILGLDATQSSTNFHLELLFDWCTRYMLRISTIGTKFGCCWKHGTT